MGTVSEVLMDLSVNTSHNLTVSHNSSDYNNGVYTILKVTYILVIVFGSVGNILSIIILRRQEIGNMPIKIYLISLAVVDLLCLDVSAPMWLLHLFNVHAMRLHDVTCKLINYYPFVLLGISYWVQVSISVDRYIATAMPFKYRSIKNKHRAATIAIIVVFYSLIYCDILFNYKIINNDTENPRCGLEVGNVYYRNYITYYWPCVDLVISFLLPFAIMAFCSVVMVRHLAATHRFIRSSSTASRNFTKPSISIQSLNLPTTSSTSIQNLTKTSTQNLTVTSATSIQSLTKSTVNETHSFTKTPKTESDIVRNTTKLFIALNIVFVATNLPKRILLLIVYTTHINFGLHVYHIAWILMYTNHAVNFIFYTLHVPKFRQVLRSLCCKNLKNCRNEQIVDGNTRENGKYTETTQITTLL